MLLTRLHMITHHRPQGFIVSKRLGDVVSSSSYPCPLKEEAGAARKPVGGAPGSVPDLPVFQAYRRPSLLLRIVKITQKVMNDVDSKARR
jgi:hypothetical protein